jgi:hypothetical protein
VSPHFAWIKKNKILCWIMFWGAWFCISAETIIPGAIAFGVGYSYYRERGVNLASIAATWLGVTGFLALAHVGGEWPHQVRLWIGMGSLMSVIVLVLHYPMFGFLVLSAISRRGYYGYGRRWW